jgi:hypothetical protein
MFSLQQKKIWRTRGQNRFCPEVGGGRESGVGEVSQIMYTHVSKCKNVKIKKKLIKDVFIYLIIFPIAN